MMEQIRTNTGKYTALVTGASSGIGVHYARHLAARGYNVILVSNQEKAVQETARQIAVEQACQYLHFSGEQEQKKELPSGQWITGLYKDLAQPASAGELFDFCTGHRIEIEVLINNAGIFIFNDLINCSITRITTILQLHIHTVTLLCRLFGEKMKNRGRGYILNMSSISTHTPFPGISLYTATKSYIRTLTKAFRYELKEYGVHVLVVSPGAVATDLYHLPEHLQRLGINLGIIYRPEKLAGKALDKLFRGRQEEYVPGKINLLFKPVYALLPGGFKMWVRKKTTALKK